jgi:hypothetical protein
MKQITEDLTITGIDISIARLGALVKFRYLDEYDATAWYLRRSSGNQWLETSDEVNTRTHDAITTEVEDNEEDILTWVEEQFAKETDQVDPVQKSYGLIELQKMNIDKVVRIAQGLGIPLGGLTKMEVIYEVYKKQANA